MTEHIFIFGGTTEGRVLSGFAETEKIPCYVSVATEYGREVLPESMKFCRILEGRMDGQQMIRFFRKKNITAVIDATHPYAVEVSRNIKSACHECGIKYLRVLRAPTPLPESARVFPSSPAAAEFLSGTKEKILLCTGSKELSAFAAVRGFADRVYARMLPLESSVKAALRAGLPEKNLILEKGPFTVQDSIRHICESGAGILVTKDSGREGGMPEKLEAAEKTGCLLTVIRRPEEENGITVGEAERIILEKWGEGK